ncbi:MAG: class I SAM-dependent methyltransferase [Anaerolineae bacterium]|nr:class I SAM-dependent methyltransferase [Anaerolineae bacterium]
MPSLSFDTITVPLYDESRYFNPVRFNASLDFIVQRYPPQHFPQVIEPGIGTGRIAIPLARRGYSVKGNDISYKMLKRLKEKVNGELGSIPITYQLGDATRLQFRDRAFDMAIVTHLFHLVPDWKTTIAELLRVTKANGPIIMIDTGWGAEIPQLNRRYTELCSEFGQPVEPAGTYKEELIIKHFKHLGCRVEIINKRWQWVARNHLGQSLSFIEKRAYSFTTYASLDIHQKVVAVLKSELEAQYGSLDVEIETQDEISMVIMHSSDDKITKSGT